MSSYTYNKINSHVVKPLINRNTESKDVRGYELIPELYANIFVCAKKKSGKSNLIWDILKKGVGPKTKIIIFSATLHRDPTYKHIVSHFEKKGNVIISYTSIIEDKQDNLANILDELGDDVSDDEDAKDDEEEPERLPIILTNDYFEKKLKRKRKPKSKLLAPDLIFVFDDISNQLRGKSVARLVKANRHYKAKTIISSQYVCDIMPEVFNQLDFCILFGGHEDSKIYKIHKAIDLSIDPEKFLQLYKDVTSKRFDFLWIDIVHERFRKNFNTEVEI